MTRGARDSRPTDLEEWVVTDLEQDLRRLREQARTDIGRWSSRTPIRSAVYHLTRGRIDQRPRYNVIQLPTLPTPWQDTDSGRHFGWRYRQANLYGELAFVVEYIICPHCGIGWADRPYTVQEFQRNGLAAAGLEALRAEHPAVAWYTGSGHMNDAKAFWAAVGDGVPGGYRPGDLCRHVARHGGLLPRWQWKRLDQR
ncbi:hypothetical protein [Jidongwangia harbinensis]|uniref:hypothetical protein n=1 Tax=Jidongwangia harbinensis TaxID=2878561 RepID=UPI001CD979D8|nr:hypothetical protein [Jidongwangia harbinensis]MCA2218042.1 hypothetical protein [Jidongwangia harbinensis]